MPSLYTPLHVRSTYSFLEGASHPDELVEEAHRLGLRSIALTDRDGVYGVVRAHMKARELGIHLVIGSELTMEDGTTILVYAADREGYANLCRVISRGRLRSAKGECKITWQELCEHQAGCIACWGGSQSLLIHSSAPRQTIDRVREAFGDRLYALIERHYQPNEGLQEYAVRDWAARYDIPLAGGMEVLYHQPGLRELQDILTCIRLGVTLPAAGTKLKPNAEHSLRSGFDFERLFADDEGLVRRTNDLAERCTFTMNEIHYRYPSEKLPDGSTSADWLRQMTFDGARDRYPEGIPADVRRQLNRELALVGELEYDGYFLTMKEIVRFCRERDILCQGRGSAANSAVCYCLGITAVDPVRMGLLFERFLSRERAEPPDIDLDIEHNRREEVIQHMYTRYGREHAAMVANVIRYRSRSAIREVGKVLGFPEPAIERFANLLSHYDSLTRESVRDAGFEADNPFHANLLRLASDIQGVPRHLSIHPGGFLLGHEPVHDLVPIENATMADRTVIQWDKDDVEDLGLFKVDLLGLGALNVVHRAFDLVAEHAERKLTMATIPAGDQETYAMIRKADTVGLFQIESRAQMAMLPRLKPTTFYDLVVEVSIVRPGPITGGMVHPYLRRRNGEEKITYPHPSLEPILKKTLGVPLFQEQVMKLAMVAADYTPGEADQLRRDMAAWRKTGRIDRHRERLIGRMAGKGISREFAERVFEQIRGFGEYGFPESHAASFALIAYVTAWLKCHYPAAFLCGLLNAQPMGFYSPATLVEDAKRRHLTIMPIDVQRSAWDCTLEPEEGSGEGFAVRMGLRYVKGLHRKDGGTIERRRPQGGYTSLDNLILQCGLEESIGTRLAEAGALECFDNQRRNALWNALGSNPFADDAFSLTLREQATRFDPLSAFEEINWDLGTSSHSSRGHPLESLREELRSMNLPDAASIRRFKNGVTTHYAGMVICRQRPGTAKGVVFMTLEDETGFVNLVLWERVYQDYKTLARTTSFLGVTGKVQSQSGVVHLVAEKLWIPNLNRRPTKVPSRDFH